MKDEESSNAPRCRYCLSGPIPGSAGRETLLTDVCDCRGGLGYVHGACLEAWRLLLTSRGRSAEACSECRAPYRMTRPDDGEARHG